MDPDAALAQMLDALLSGDFDEARGRLRDLEGWSRAGCHPPKDPRAN